MISSFRGDYFFLSNFYESSFCFLGEEWKTVEHAFQAFKSRETALQKHIRDLPDAKSAKKAGHKVPLRDDWDIIKFPLMEQLVRAKFMQNVELAHMLINISDQDIVEGNTWHDNVFGDCHCQKCVTIEGQNWLGNILMLIQGELIDMGFDE